MTRLTRDRYSNKTIDSSSPSLAYSSDWTYLSSLAGPTGAMNAAITQEWKEDMGRFHNGSASVSLGLGGRVNLTFEGEYLLLHTCCARFCNSCEEDEVERRSVVKADFVLG